MEILGTYLLIGLYCVCKFKLLVKFLTGLVWFLFYMAAHNKLN